jgi:hypothetical protein
MQPAALLRAPHARTREPRLPKVIKGRINQLAHHCALRHEAQVKAALLEQMQRMAEAGATPDDLARVMDRHEEQEGRQEGGPTRISGSFKP